VAFLCSYCPSEPRYVSPFIRVCSRRGPLLKAGSRLFCPCGSFSLGAAPAVGSAVSDRVIGSLQTELLSGRTASTDFANCTELLAVLRLQAVRPWKDSRSRRARVADSDQSSTARSPFFENQLGERGQKIDVRNTIIIMTSNVGAETTALDRCLLWGNSCRMRL
jgi:hypothetical protein